MDAPEGRTLQDRVEAWPVDSSEDLYRDDWVLALRADRVRRPDDPDGESFRRLVLEHPGAVIVLAVDDDGQVCLLRQYRHPARRQFVELPAGLCDVEGEEPELTARRELREEVALEAEEWTHLGSFHSSPGISEEVMHFYLAQGLREVDRGDFTPVHEEAEMEVFRAPFRDLVEAVLDGRVADAPVALATLLVVGRALHDGGPAAE
ncbi:NUDIX domain-containing protein [Nocardioides sp. GXQ0305]|uniref:NUDIX domain-containing protein n=1 Tax=Nocardioides sp. GXQ0305 TaxID=3423912 RepID=UPI003D7DC5B1